MEKSRLKNSETFSGHYLQKIQLKISYYRKIVNKQTISRSHDVNDLVLHAPRKNTFNRPNPK